MCQAYMVVKIAQPKQVQKEGKNDYMTSFIKNFYFNKKKHF